MVPRTSLRHLVSAVNHLDSRQGVTAAEIKKYLEQNLGYPKDTDYRRLIKSAVNDGVLEVNGNRLYCPLSQEYDGFSKGANITMARRQTGNSRRGRSRTRRGRRHAPEVEYLTIARRRRRVRGSRRPKTARRSKGRRSRGRRASSRRKTASPTKQSKSSRRRSKGRKHDIAENAEPSDASSPIRPSDAPSPQDS